jgi:hypothetical protein
VCDWCAGAIAAQGGDADKCRAQLAAVAEQCLAEGVVVPDAEVDAYLADAVADYAAFATSRTHAVTSLVAELVDASGGRPVEFVAYGDRSISGVDLAAIERAGADVRVLAYGPAPVVEASVSELRAAADVPKRFGLGLSALGSDAADEADLRAAHEVAVQSGASSVAFYNYGMLPATRRRWLGALLRRS